MDINIEKINDLINEYNKSDSKFTLKLYVNVKERSYLKFDQIMQSVCMATGITAEYINMKSREPVVLLPRQMCHYIASKCTKKTLSEIGKYFGNKDHATVLNSVKKIQNYLDTDKEFRDKYGDLLNSCHSVHINGNS